MIKILTAAVGCLFAAGPLFAQALTIDQVAELSAAGLGDEAIIAKMRRDGATFDLSAAQMLDLKRRGVSAPVIAAMLGTGAPAATISPAMSLTSPDPMAPHPAGVYLLVKGPSVEMQKLDATVVNQAKSGGIWGYVLTGGIASLSIKATIQNETARVGVGDPSPVFFFFFDESNPEAARQSVAWTSGTAATVNSPSEFTLIRLNEKDGRREARVGSMNIGGTKTGVMDQDRIAFQYDAVRPGVYRVTPREPLEPGEYGFIYSLAAGGAAGALAARIFDFSVQPRAGVQLASVVPSEHSVSKVAPSTSSLPPAAGAQWRQASYSPGTSIAFIDAASVRRQGDVVRFQEALYYRPDQGSDHFVALREASCRDRSFRNISVSYYLGKSAAGSKGESAEAITPKLGTVDDETVLTACGSRKFGKLFEDPDAAAASFFSTAK